MYLCKCKIESKILKLLTWLFSAKISSKWFYRVLRLLWFSYTKIFRLIIMIDRELRFIHLLWWLLFKCRQVNMKRTYISLCSIYKASFGLGRHSIYFMIIWTTVMMFFYVSMIDWFVSHIRVKKSIIFIFKSLRKGDIWYVCWRWASLPPGHLHQAVYK